MTNNLERRDLVDKADAWDAIAAKNAEITHLQEALAAAETKRDRSAREWRSAFDNMHQRAMTAEARIAAVVGALQKSRKAWLAYGMETDPEIEVPFEHRNLLAEIDAALALLTTDPLPALLAETRKKALEEAAQVADDYAAGSDAEVKDSEEWGDAYGIDLNMQLSATANGIAAAIRSLSNEEAPK